MTLEISVLMAQFPSRRIAETPIAIAPLGLGYANIGGLLMNMGIPMTAMKAGRSAAR